MSSNLEALTTIFTEFYYWVAVVFMFLIHIGFCLYEVGASRRRNHMHTLLKNVMIIPVVTVTFFLFGWWIYNAFPRFPVLGGLEDAASSLPTATAMGQNLDSDDRLTGVFWAAFLMFSWTAASIVSGSVIERIRSSALWIHAIAIGSILILVSESWSWHPNGWMVELLGFHDGYASGAIHAISGGYALGLLTVLGPRVGKFAADGTPRAIPPHHPWLLTIGIFMIYAGFWGFYAACNIPIISAEGAGLLGTDWTTTTIYGTPTTLSGNTANFLMSLSGGMMAAYVVSKGDAFWTFSGGLAGLIAASAGNDLYHPLQALLIGAVGCLIAYKLHFWVERKFKIDDAVGAVAVHGYAGFFGVVIAGFLLWGIPSSPNESYAAINPIGQFVGAVILFFVLGFVPAWVIAKIQMSLGYLRIPETIEIQGLDYAEHHEYEEAKAYIIASDIEKLSKQTPTIKQGAN